MNATRHICRNLFCFVLFCFCYFSTRREFSQKNTIFKIRGITIISYLHPFPTSSQQDIDIGNFLADTARAEETRQRRQRRRNRHRCAQHREEEEEDNEDEEDEEEYDDDDEGAIGIEVDRNRVLECKFGAFVK